MDTSRRPRIAIAVEPAILADALAEVLRDADVDEVVDLRDNPDPDHVDAAVVTIALPGTLDADVVIKLPDALVGTGAAGIRVHGQRASVRIESLDDILRLLDDYCPGRRGRRA